MGDILFPEAFREGFDGRSEAEISKLEIQLADKRNQRDLVYNGMWDKIKRVRAGVKANYGDDSQQFEMVGGARVSDRKPPTRRVPAA